ncbi:RNA-binding protein Jag [Dehalobacter sp. UNSWDHB]|jgi:Predicted RNA-binding protein|uniref:RNA-binding cell elongation regulator Jag/EloR n=1 Tax=unclassified Dehalobacter TaxID=2635733 RepID=UPI00028B2695|nr:MULTISPECIES: RNA-binding cell elongation regulator Jag/EloR [unclassified Dehalobacter]AFV04003.1 RNA-binding protein Jag [Dehalobacter sp. DCA]AFV06983.1 RNA-binding protein Jag [Dehalobacter sp. CF]EQB22484.1 RNA-binding protein Jag [Dehalobacter sp. UNSWDHB]
MKVADKTAKTVEEAIELGLAELGVSRDQVTVQVLEEPGKKGILGLFGSKMARVRINFEDDPGALACEFLKGLTKAMSVNADFEVFNRDEQVKINITGLDLGILIGRRGDTLESIQFLTNLAVAKKLSNKTRIVIDVEGYRKRREETLIVLAKRLAEKVKKSGNRIVLEPMSPQERRIIHTALQNELKVTTFSEGEEPHRRVVVALKRNHIEKA